MYCVLWFSMFRELKAFQFESSDVHAAIFSEIYDVANITIKDLHFIIEVPSCAVVI